MDMKTTPETANGKSSAHSFTEGADVPENSPTKNQDIEQTAEEVPWELKIIRQLWKRAYLDSEEDHIKILKEYGEKIASLRTKQLQERIKNLEADLEAARYGK